MISVALKDWTVLDSVRNTQDFAADLVRRGIVEDKLILAREQTAGKGRFDRRWSSPAGESLSMSAILVSAKGHGRPWLFGMAMACAAAGVVHCRVRWPNDLYLDGRKLGGVLTEIVEGIPVVGLGLNLLQKSFPPDLADRAISLYQHRQGAYDPIEIASRIVTAFNRSPELHDWADLAPIWDMFDDTPGKLYRLPDETEAKAMGIGPHGELLCTVNGEARIVMAAEALLAAAPNQA